MEVDSQNLKVNSGHKRSPADNSYFCIPNGSPKQQKPGSPHRRGLPVSSNNSSPSNVYDYKNADQFLNSDK